MQKGRPCPCDAIVLDFFLAREQKVVSAVEASRRPRALVARPPARCARKAASRHNDCDGAPAGHRPKRARADSRGGGPSAARMAEAGAKGPHAASCSRCRRSPDDHARLPRAPRRRYTLDANARVWYVSSQPRTGRLLLRRAQGAGLCRPAAPARAAGGAQAQAASERELPYQLLRRAADYEVRRYPLYVAGQHRVRAAALAPLLANERKCLSRGSCRGNCVGRRVGRG